MNRYRFLILVGLFFISQDALLASSEVGTFDAFYVESSTVSWIVAGVSAIVAGAVVFFTGGAASPIVAWIGGAIGNMAGLYGAAATNYGLALLGGGAVAAGGFGVVGGTTLLTVALGFSTDVVIDYSVGSAISKYSYNEFVKDSKNMITLPIPQNESGSDMYEKEVEYLKEHIDKKEPLSSRTNQLLLSKVLREYSDYIREDNKDLILKSYLNFVTGNYKDAKDDASMAISNLRREELKRTLPAFIYAVSSLYNEHLYYSDYKYITKNYFSYAILAEPDNKLIPLMFAIYMDRLMYRMDSNENLNYRVLDMLKDIVLKIEDKDLKAQSLILVAMRYIMRLKIEQQKILSLANSQNQIIRNSPITLDTVHDSMFEYRALLNRFKMILSYDEVSDALRNEHKLGELIGLYASYKGSIPLLERAIGSLESR
jgi:hypothetical protein